MKNKKDELLDATMQVISENGFGGFSMKQVTQLVGVGETLVYKHFDTKENLLHECFLKFHEEISEFLKGYSLEELRQKAMEEGVLVVFQKVWMDYLDFLVRGSYHTVYYFEYRDSIYVQNVLKRRELFYLEHLSDFEERFNAFSDMLGLDSRDKIHIFWSNILDGIGKYACRIIRGEISDSPQNREMMWRMVCGGISSCI